MATLPKLRVHGNSLSRVKMHIPGPIPELLIQDFKQAVQLVLYKSWHAISLCDVEPPALGPWRRGSPLTSSLVEGVLCAWHGGEGSGL